MSKMFSEAEAYGTPVEAVKSFQDKVDENDRRHSYDTGHTEVNIKYRTHATAHEDIIADVKHALTGAASLAGSGVYAATIRVKTTVIRQTQKTILS